MRCGFRVFYIALLLYSLHWSIIVYINSSYLEQFFNTQTISILYILASLITLTAYLSASFFLNRTGTVRLTIILTIVEILALCGMAFTQSLYSALILFIIHQTITPLILYTLDVLMEGLIGKNETTTGGHRGIFLTIGSFTTAIALLIMGLLVGDTTPHFGFAYAISAFLLIPFLAILIYNFSKYSDPHYVEFRVLENITHFWQKTDIRNVFFSHFFLQVFFAWMVIYTPLYLAHEMHFGWREIGLIIFVAMLAYVFLEYFIGYLADNFFGEKEMMALGFVIMSVSISWFVFLDNSSILLWMGAMFMTRVGASFVEVTTESYFFKQTKNSDASTIGIFRIAQPLAYIIGPVIGGLLLMFFSFSFTFVIIGLLMIFGLFFTMTLKDTQ